MCKKEREVSAMYYTHIAYNKDSGEVITATRGNHLKRLVQRANRWAIRHGFPTGRWVFGHDGNIKF